MASDADAAPIVARTVGELRARAAAIGLAREQAAAEKLAAEHEGRVREADKARQPRLLAIAQRGDGVWREVEAEIERRNAAAYDKAAGLLRDLQAVAKERGTIEDFLVDFARSVRSMSARNGSSNGWLHCSSASRLGIDLAGHDRR